MPASPTTWETTPTRPPLSSLTSSRNISNPKATCRTILESGNSNGSGIYRIDLDGDGEAAAFPVRCDMASDGGGWTRLWIRGGSNRDGFLIEEGGQGVPSGLAYDPSGPNASIETNEACRETFKLTYFDAAGNKIPETQLDALSARISETVYEGDVSFRDPDGAVNSPKEFVHQKSATLGSTGASMPIYHPWTAGGPASGSVTHTLAPDTQSSGTIGSRRRTINADGLVRVLGISETDDTTGNLKWSGFSCPGAVSNSVLFENAYYWAK